MSGRNLARNELFRCWVGSAGMASRTGAHHLGSRAFGVSYVEVMEAFMMGIGWLIGGKEAQVLGSELGDPRTIATQKALSGAE